MLYEYFICTISKNMFNLSMSSHLIEKPVLLNSMYAYDKKPLAAEFVQKFGSSVVLIGMRAGPKRPAFSNWIKMAKHFRYDYALLGKHQPYVPHYSKAKAPYDFIKKLPAQTLVCILDSTDGFICAGPDTLRRNFLSYNKSIVFGAEKGPYPENSWKNNEPWSWCNAGFIMGYAGALTQTYHDILTLSPKNNIIWDRYGHFCDQHAFNLYFLNEQTQNEATIDDQRKLVWNWDPSNDDVMDIAKGATCAVHFFGNRFAYYDIVGQTFKLKPLCHQSIRHRLSLLKQQINKGHKIL